MVADEQLVEFLDQQGAVQILLWLVDGPKRFTELYERVDVARATLSKRLQRGKELGLWEVTTLVTDDGDEVSRYELAKRGDEIAEYTSDTPALRHLQSLYNTRKDFEEDRITLLERVRENAESSTGD